MLHTDTSLVPNPRICPDRGPFRSRWTIAAILLGAVFGACARKHSGLASSPAELGGFVEIHESAGIDFVHAFRDQPNDIDARRAVTGGVACGDYDKDGYPDLYVITGDLRGNLLYRNRGDGTFEELSEQAGVRLRGGSWCGATFADMNGDGFLDLFVGGVVDAFPCLLMNQRDGTFADATPGSGLEAVNSDSFSVAFADYDRDGDLDMFLTQWNVQRQNESTQHLWRNEGGAKFTDMSVATGISQAFRGEADSYTDLSLTPNFVDIDNDGFLDLLITGDLGTNKVLRNVDIGGGVRGFRSVTNDVLALDRATGAGIGDYDNDGYIDWFVSGVYPESGNRLYRNLGDGTFQDMTDIAGVRDGGYGWASSFADFDNDGHLDLVQVNGFGTDSSPDPIRLFMSDRDGTFTERAAQLGLDDFGQGRGVVCFDFDRDGDLDIFVANSQGEPKLFRNDLTRGNHLAVRLNYTAGNDRGIGARVAITVGETTQIREIRCGSNYVSQNPAEAHFGLGRSVVVDRLVVSWPDGTTTTQTQVPAGQLVTITR